MPAQSFFTHKRTGRCVHERSSCPKRKSSREMENERIRILLERQKEQILAGVRSEIQNHEFQADSDRRRLIENQDTINELTTRIQELQNEVNCPNDSKDFQDTESVRSGVSHVPSQTALLPLFRDPDGMLSRKDKSSDIWDTHDISGNVFVNPSGSSSSLFPAGFNP